MLAFSSVGIFFHRFFYADIVFKIRLNIRFLETNETKASAVEGVA